MMIPITRKEKYINEIVGGGDTAPETPQTREEFFFAEILGEVVAPSPITRAEKYLAKIANKYSDDLPEPVTRIERFLARAAGMDVTIPVPVTREEMFWAAYAGVEIEIEGVPPLTFTAKAGTLSNYRIYGNTVNGESVGDRTGNLFDGFIQGIRLNTSTGLEEKNNTSYTSGFIGVENDKLYSYSGGSDTTSIAFFAYDSSKNYIGRSTNTERADTIIYTSTTFSNYTSFSTSLTGNTNPIAYIRITHVNAEQTVIDDEQIMLNSGSEPLPYEPYGYKVPVTVSNGADTLTTPIYLPEPIKMVGSEAEYVDYAEQKMHRVRKNLLPNRATSQTIKDKGVTFTVNSDGSVTCNGTATGVTFFAILMTINQGSYIVSGTPAGSSLGTPYVTIRLRVPSGGSDVPPFNNNDIGTGVTISSDKNNNNDYFYKIRVPQGYTCDNLTFYPMIRKADTEDDTYEPYIENTEVDVTIPALPTLSGTNTLSFKTTVQPSKVMIKTGKFGTHKVRYYDSDGTFLSAEDVKDGTNAQGFTPTKASTAQYNYTFMGWSTTKGSTTAETGVLNDITADKSLYAVFSQSLKTFTVYFYNDSTLLQTAENVQYGGTATYTGTTPTSSQTGYIFDGWNPSNTNITADTSCYAQFVDEDMYESISDTWSEIIANVSNGTYSTKYHIGDTKKIDLGTEGEVIMTIVGIDTDDLADNSGKAPITWISKQLLKTSHRMNPSYQSGTEGTGTLGGWEKTVMRSYLKETVKPLIPEAVRNAIKPVKKYSMIYNVSGSAVNDVLTTEDVWIPSYKEVFGSSGSETLGPTYSATFPDDTSRIKSKAGSGAAWWWLRSATSSSYFLYVTTNGSRSKDNAYNTGGVTLGFCT